MAREHAHGVESTMQVFGHPIHPMLVPLPITSLLLVAATDLLYLARGDAFWAEASLWLLWVGVVSALLAGAVGAVDYMTIARARATSAGRIHAVGNLLAVGVAVANLMIRDENGGDIAGAGVILSLVVAVLLIVTAWYGGELSYRHRIGVMATDDAVRADTPTR